MSYTAQGELLEERLTDSVIGVFYEVYNTLGYMIEDDKLIVEGKSTEQLHKSTSRQVYNYLRATNLEVGLLLHFGPEPTFQRLICRNKRSDRPHSPHPIEQPK